MKEMAFFSFTLLLLTPYCLFMQKGWSAFWIEIIVALICARETLWNHTDRFRTILLMSYASDCAFLPTQIGNEIHILQKLIPQTHTFAHISHSHT